MTGSQADVVPVRSGLTDNRGRYDETHSYH